MARPTKKDLQAELKQVRKILARDEQQLKDENNPTLLEDIEQTKLLIKELENEILHNF
tara:strand:- start:816 stop:989 length:174 start_codon:yes stop_codon:yes gene_type:complete